MRAREVRRLVRMVDDPPRRAPRWLTPEMVLAATPLDGLDIIARADMRHRRMLLLLAVCRTAVDDLRAGLEGDG